MRLDDTLVIPKIKFTTEDEKLSNDFNRLVEGIKRKNMTLEQGVLLFANAKGHVLDIVYSNTQPIQFFSKEKKEALDFTEMKLGPNAIHNTAMHLSPSSAEPFTFGPLKKLYSVSIPIFNENGSIVAIFGYLSESEGKEDLIKTLHYLELMFELNLEKEQQSNLMQELEKKEALLNISQIIHSFFDVNDVLLAAVKNINLFYPNDQLELFMTQDYALANVPIKQLTFIPNQKDINGKAFIEGKTIINKRSISSEDYFKGEMAIPLKGKQAIYGVLHVTCVDACDYKDEKVEFISKIADILSNAFENANLYQQSINSVKELQIVNELTKRLNQTLDKESILQFVITESTKIFTANHVCIFQLDSEMELLSIVASNNQSNIGNTISANYGYMGLVYKNKEPIIIADIKSDNMEDTFIKNFGYRSLISVPIKIKDEILGIIALFSKEKHHFSYENFRMLQLLAQHLGLTLTNAILHERIQQLAITDYLSNLYNRAYLDNSIEKSFHQDNDGSILLFDIDDFKNINDHYGHATGDEVLIQIAEIIKSSIRIEDVAARWGGEEIALYLPNAGSKIAIHVANRIRERIKNETTPRVTISCGISTWSKANQMSLISFIKQADEALYQAKNFGKDQVRVYNQL